MPRVLRRARALPSLRTLLLHWSLLTIDEQAIALSLALAAYGSVSQARTTARLARRRQFFIHSVGLVSVGLKTRALGGGQSTEGPNASTHPTANVRARNKLPKGLSRLGGVTALAGIVAIGIKRLGAGFSHFALGMGRNAPICDAGHGLID